MEEAAGLAESTSVLLNVSEFSSIEDATSALTSTMQAFGYTAKQSMDVVDVLNEVGNNFAISSDGIATALQDSASSLMAANNSYEEAVALIAAANRVVQDPNSVGSALRTISLRLRGTGVKELEEAGEDTAGAITSKSKLRSKIKSLSGVDILTDTGAYKSTYEILLEISKVWKDISDIDQAALLEILAGKNRANTAAAILSNTKDLEEAYTSAMKAEGSAYAENEKYLDSIQGKIDQFNNALQTMWSNTLDDSWIKGFVALGTELVKLINNLGLIKTLIVAIGGIWVSKNFGAELFNISNNSITNIDAINQKLQQLKSTYESAQKAFATNGNKFNQNKLRRAKENYELYDVSTSAYRKADELSKHIENLHTKSEDLQLALHDAKQELDDIWAQGESGELGNEFDNACQKVDNLNNAIKQNEQDIQRAKLELQQYQQTTQTIGTTGAITWKKVGNGIKTAAKATGKMISSMLAMYAVTTAIELVASGVELLISAIDGVNESAEEAQDKLDQMSSEVSNCDSELRSLESELSNTKNRMDELSALGTLSYVEQEELERLQAATAELERQIELKNTLQGSLQKGANAAAVNATNKYLDTSFYSEKSKSERQEEAAENGEAIGKAAGLAIGATATAALVASGTKIGAAIGTAVGPGVGTVIGAGVGALIGGIAGKIIGSAGAGAKYDSEETVSEVIANMEETRANLIKTRDEAFAAYVENPQDEDLAEKYKEAEDALNTYDAAMAKHISQIQANYNAMDWDVASASQKEFMREQADLLDKYNIAMGGEDAKFNAITRIFGDEASSELEHVEDKINDAVNAGKNFDLKEIFGDERLYNAFEERLNSIGLTIQDVIDYFNNMKVARDEALETTSITDSLSKISALETAFNSLGDAVKEFKEEGAASASTLQDLHDAFKDIDGFEELYKVLATGEGDVVEAITNVANAYINQRGVLEDLTEDELQIMTSRLQSLGVINAQEILQARQTAQTKLNETIQGYNIDLSAYATAEQAKIAIAAQAGLDFSKINDDNLNDLIAKYNIDVNTYKTAAEQKIQIAKEMAIETAKANQAAALSELNSAYVGSERYRQGYKDKKQAILDEYNAAVNLANSVETTIANVGSILDEYYNTSFKFDFSDGKTGIGRDYEDPAGGDSGSDDKLDKLRKQYENQIAQLEAQQTYLQNEIDRMEAEGKQVGKGIYEEQIRLEEEKIKLYEQERAALLEQMKTVKQGSPEWFEYADAVWETEHAIQDSTLAIVEHKQAIADLYVGVFDKLEEAFSKQSELYDKQSEYIRNNIEYQELLGEPISAGSYKDLIGIQEDKYDNAIKKVAELESALELGVGTDGVELTNEQIAEMTLGLADAKLEAQEARNEIVNINKELKELYITAFDKVKEVFDALDDLRSDRQSYTQRYMEYMDLIGEPIPTSGYDYLIEQENKKLADNIELLGSLREKQRAAIEEGNVEVGSEEWINMESEIRDCESAILDNKIAIEEYNKELQNLYVEAFEHVKKSFGNEVDLYNDQQAYIEGYMDYLDTIGVKVPTEMYDKLIAIEEQKKQANVQQLNDLRSSLARMEAQGIGPDDDEWIQAQSDIRAVEKAIWDSEVAMAQFNKTVRELETEKFEEFIKRIGDITDELENVYDLLSDEDVATEDGAWTEEGITSLGLMVQKMEIAKKQTEEYQKEIDELTRSYKAGEISEQEYNDRLVELKNSQWDSIDAYESAKDAIIDINEARIDMIEEGIQDEIDAYKELIDLKKEELDAERDLYEFRNNINKQTKDISALERRIASMSGSTDAATIAERTKLEAQLREAREGLDDTYYSHAMDSQSSALDDENEAYVTSKEDYVELLRESLEDVEAIVANTMSQVLINADVVLGELNSVSGEYGITLSDSLMLPWTTAAAQAEEFKNSAIAQEYEFLIQNGIFTGQVTQQIDALFGAGSLAANNFQTGVYTVIDLIRTKVEQDNPILEGDLKYSYEQALSYAQNTFSTKVQAAIQSVADKAKDVKIDEATDLTEPFKKATESANTFGDAAEKAIKKAKDKAVEYNPTLTKNLTTPIDEATNKWGLFGSTVAGVFSKMITDAQTAASQVGSDMNNIVSKAQAAAAAIRDAYGAGTGDPNDDVVDPYIPPQRLSKSYQVTASISLSGQELSGYGMGDTEMMAKKNALTKLATNFRSYYKSKGYDDAKIEKLWSNTWLKRVQYTGLKKYAKGTLGTKDDQWALTDEIGDELVLVPGKGGNLSFMRKGTSVVPADITENLMEWGKLKPNMDNMSNAIHGVNLVTNAINKPELNLEIENLLRCDNVSQDSLPELKKFMTEELDKFARQLNYNIKRVGGR